MKNFTFNGDWETLIHLPIISQLNSTDFFKPTSGIEYRRQIYKNLQEELVIVNFISERNDNPDPNERQINAVNFIINNEDAIYSAIYRSFKELVIPTFLSYEYYDFSDETFHEIQSIEELPEHLGISSIDIWFLGEGSIGLTIFNFEFSGDMEHGLSIIFKGDEFLRQDAMGSFDFEGLIPDKDYKDYIYNYNSQNIEIDKFLLANPKYNKLKPWQIDNNSTYITNLIYDNKNNKLIELFQSKYIGIDYKVNNGDTLLKIAEECNNEEIIEFLINESKKQIVINSL